MATDTRRPKHPRPRADQIQIIAAMIIAEIAIQATIAPDVTAWIAVTIWDALTGIIG